jgi:hypothetical protein
MRRQGERLAVEEWLSKLMASSFKLTNDKVVQRLRWVMVGVMLFDTLNTILGQPASYWQHPATAEEGDPFFYFFLSHGLFVYLLFSLVYFVSIFLIVSVIPRRTGLMVIFAFILGHFLGAASWPAYRWHFGVLGLIIYGILLSVLIVLAAFPDD